MKKSFNLKRALAGSPVTSELITMYVHVYTLEDSTLLESKIIPMTWEKYINLLGEGRIKRTLIHSSSFEVEK